MNKTLLVIGTILGGIGLFVGGLFFGQVNAQAIQSDLMMGNWNGQAAPEMMSNFEGQYGTDMMNDTGMMGGIKGQYGTNMMNGSGMMGMMMNGNMMGNGMMSNFGGLASVDPLSTEEAETAVADYLSTFDDADLTLGEIMIFDNHAYAQIVDESTETGAFEVLVDPVTRSVSPEPGPNMMWNTEYGMMADSGSFGMMGMMAGNMMGSLGYTSDAEINVTANEAINIAQEYLDANLPGKTADETADTFPGYYTIHIVEDGETIGMLSVNAYTSQVFLHHWHGDFIEMVGEDHE